MKKYVIRFLFVTGFFAIIAVSCLAAFHLALVTFVIEMMNLVKNSTCEITNAQTEDGHNNSEALQVSKEYSNLVPYGYT